MVKRLLWCALVLALAGVGTAQEADDEDETVIEEGTGEPVPEDEADKPATPQRKTAFPARKKGQKYGRVRLQGKDKVYSLELPDDWAAETRDYRDAVLGYYIRLPGTNGIAPLVLYERKDIGDARVAPFLLQESALRTHGAPQADIGQKPLPRLVVPFDRDGKAWVATYAFRRIRGRVLYLRMECPKETWPGAEADYLHAARSIRGKPALWPPVPEGYKTKAQGRWLFAMPATLKASTTHIAKILKTQEKRFTKLHGKLPKPSRNEPTVVFVHGTKGQAGSIVKEAAENQTNHYVDVRHGRLFTIPVHKNNTEESGYLAGAAQGLLYRLKYGRALPLWVYNGEMAVARAEEATGKALPTLHLGMANWRQETKPVPLDQLEELRTSDGSAFYRLSFFYVAMFHAGKSTHRKAYRAFLKELGETFDADAAYRRHIEPLGLGTLRDDLRTFMYERIVAIQPKER